MMEERGRREKGRERKRWRRVKSKKKRKEEEEESEVGSSAIQSSPGSDSPLSPLNGTASRRGREEGRRGRGCVGDGMEVAWR